MKVNYFAVYHYGDEINCSLRMNKSINVKLIVVFVKNLKNITEDSTTMLKSENILYSLN
jgi:hypothetical protein